MFSKKNKTAFENFLKTKYERITGELVVRSYPYFMAIDPSSICGLKCPFCPTGSENWGENGLTKGLFRKRTTMSIELFDAILDELGEYLFMILFFNWGEPLLNKNLPYFIKEAKSFDIYTEIHTNLSLKISDEKMEELLLSGIDEVAGSIDGFSAESYANYRRGGDFDLAKGNIERLASIRDRLGLHTRIVWNFLVFSFNENEVDKARVHCEELGIVFNRREACINTKTHPGWLPSYREEELKKAPELPDKSDAVNLMKKSCAWHYGHSVVNADGSVSSCCAVWNQKSDFGLMLPGQYSFADVWNNGAFRKARSISSSRRAEGVFDINTLCENCPMTSVKDQYTPMEKHVVENFMEEFPSSEPMLKNALGLLGSDEQFAEFYCESMLCCNKSSEFFKDMPHLATTGLVNPELKAELDSVYASKSWRLTYPLRRISAWLKGMKAYR